MSATSTKAWCADCSHSKALHRREGQHACVIDGCVCERYVSASEAREVAESLKQQLKEGVEQ